jgi:hypothetical protein
VGAELGRVYKFGNIRTSCAQRCCAFSRSYDYESQANDASVLAWTAAIPAFLQDIHRATSNRNAKCEMRGVKKPRDSLELIS